MEFGAIVLGVCHPIKLKWMPQTLHSIDNSVVFKFDKKVLAIDEFDGFTFPNNIETHFAGKDWDIVKDSHKSRPKSMLHGLELVDESYDVAFYHEDDVLVNLPHKQEIEKIMSHVLPDGRECGMCSLTLGGTLAWFSNGQGIGDLANVEENTLFNFDDYFAFLRPEVGRDIHFFEFPGLFIRRDLLKQCLDYCMKNCEGIQIEQGLTRAWFELGLDQKYFKCSIAKNNLVEQLNADYKQVFHKCRLLENLDPNQGCSHFHGSHFI